MPFWFQLANLLEHEITTGRWSSGGRVASESQLCEHFRVSRTTVRQALARLEQEGLVHRRKGFGTFVADSRPRVWLLQSSEGFFQDEVDRLGRHVSSTILRREQVELPGWASDALGLPTGSAGVTMERLRCVDDRLALYVTDYLPASLADTVATLNPSESLYRRLAERDGLEVAGGRRTLEAVKAGERLAHLLDVEVGAPLAVIESVSWDRDLQPFHCYRTWLRTDRMRVEVQVSSTIRAPTGADATAAETTAGR